MNTCIITGRLTAAPEVKTTTSGKTVARFSVAVDDGFKDNKKTYFFGVNAWDKLAEFAGKYLRKGSKVMLLGKLAQRSWEKDGHKNSIVEIVAREIEFAESKKDSGGDFGKPVDQQEIPF